MALIEESIQQYCSTGTVGIGLGKCQEMCNGKVFNLNRASTLGTSNTNPSYTFHKKIISAALRLILVLGTHASLLLRVFAPIMPDVNN